jgi:hypothetical protein
VTSSVSVNWLSSTVTKAMMPLPGLLAELGPDDLRVPFRGAKVQHIAASPTVASNSG